MGKPQGQRTSHKNSGPRNLLPLDITLSGNRHVLSLSAPPVLSSGWTFSPQLSHRVRKRRQLMSVHSSPPTTTQSTLPPPGKLLRIKGIVYGKELGTGAAPTSPDSNISNNNNAHGVFIPNHLAPHRLLACPLVTPSLNPLLEAAWAVDARWVTGGEGSGVLPLSCQPPSSGTLGVMLIS